MSDDSKRMIGAALALVQSGRALDHPDARDRDRVRARLAAALGVPTLAATAATVSTAEGAAALRDASAAAASGLRRTLGAKLVVSSIVAALTASGVAVLWQRGDPPVAPAAVATSTPSAAESVELAPSTNVPSPADREPHADAGAVGSRTDAQQSPAHGARAPSAQRTLRTQPAPRREPARRSDASRTDALEPAHLPAAAPSPSSAPARLIERAASTPTLSGELALLAQAQRALRDKQPMRALTLLDEHATRYPSGVLRPERRAARVVALCRMGEHELGAAELQTLERETPSSPLIRWARSSCGL